MVTEDDSFVIHGPEPEASLPSTTLGWEIYLSLCRTPRDTVAMIDAFTEKSITYGELLDQSCSTAEALRLAGYVGQETACAISSENSLQFLVPVFASLFNGCVVVPLNHTYTPYELDHTLQISKPKLVFCSEAVAQKFIDINKKLGFIEKIILIGSKRQIKGTESLQQFVINHLRGRSIETHDFKPVCGDSSKMISVISASSGTTGLPKGVMLSHLNCMVLMTVIRCPKYFELQSGSIMGLMPFFHSYGFFIAIGSIITNKKLIVLKHFDEDIFLKVIEKYKLSILYLAPPLMVFLANTPKLEKYDLSSIKQLSCAAAPLSRDTQNEVKRRLNCNFTIQSYGLTETSVVAMTNTLSDNRAGSCGKVMPFVSCKVRDPETGKSLGSNQTGELCFKGPMIMIGYCRNERATKDIFTSDGWLRTGDIGYYDDDGYFYVIDRIKELIKYKGYQVAPAELEALLINHEKVNDAAVVGLPDESVGEKPVAFIVKKDGFDLTPEEIMKYVADNVSPQKRLSGGVIFVESIPKTASGKILRRELKKNIQYYTTQVQSKL